MSRFEILLLNCTRNEEPSEVNFLSEFFEMMRIRYPKSIVFSSVEIRSKNDFLNQLSLSSPNIVHIAAHGYSKKSKGRRGKRTSIWIKDDEEVTSQEISELPKRARKLVSVSACLTSYKDLANSFLNKGTEHYLAPKTEVGWVEAAIFFVTFYKRYLYDRKSFEDSFYYARHNTKLSKDFPEYWYSE